MRHLADHAINATLQDWPLGNFFLLLRAFLIYSHGQKTIYFALEYQFTYIGHDDDVPFTTVAYDYTGRQDLGHDSMELGVYVHEDKGHT